jgi:hypothetical protein
VCIGRCTTALDECCRAAMSCARSSASRPKHRGSERVHSS